MAGGTKLNNQEIRNCIYGGEFNNLLKLLDKNRQWRTLNRMVKSESSYRFTKQEIILRFFSFYARREKYDGRLARFLNNYMHEHRFPNDEFVQTQTELFNRTVEQIASKLFDGKSPGKLSITILEALMIGIAINLSVVTNKTADQLGRVVI